MPTISQIWWDHLAPKLMRHRLREMEEKLNRWCATSYGQFWLASAQSEGGIIRVKPGQPIPAVHFVALGNRPLFIAPQEKIRIGHRTVGIDKFQSGKPLDENELAMRPTIRLDIVTDPVLLDNAMKFRFPIHVPGVKEPSIVFSTPAFHLLAPTHWPNKSYVLYQHIFGEGGSYPDDGYFYVGLTTRSWRTRWAEHRRAMRKGSNLLFHKKLREEMDADRVTYIHHKVMGITDNVEALYSAEEYLVKGHWHDERRLNMIPGGRAGMRFMRQKGIIAETETPTPDEREPLIERWLTAHS